MSKLIGIYYKMCTESCGSYKLSVGRAIEINLAFMERRWDFRIWLLESLVNWLGQASKNRLWLLGVVSGRNVVIG